MPVLVCNTRHIVPLRAPASAELLASPAGS
jgi:hypothetical protein